MLLFPEQLRKLREAAGLRQVDLARAVGVDIPMYSRYEHGARRPKRQQVEKMARVLNADKNDLIARWLAYGVIDEIANDALAAEAVPFIKHALHINDAKSEERVVEKIIEVPVMGTLKRLTPALPTALARKERTLVASLGASHLPMIIVSDRPEASLSEIENGSVDCVVTSLPAFVDLPQALLVTQVLHRCLADDGSLWIHVADDERAMRLAVAMIDEQGWTMAHKVAWNRDEGTSRAGLQSTVHPVMHFTKGEDYYFDSVALRRDLENAGGSKPKSGGGYRRKIESSTLLTPTQKAAARNALNDALDRLSRGEIADFRLFLRESRIPLSNDSARGRAVNTEGFFLQITPAKDPETLWHIAAERDKRHGGIEVTSQQLVRAVISATCRKNGLVVDPWCNTGNTGRVALEMERRSIVIGNDDALLGELRSDMALKAERPKQATLSLF